MAVAAELRASGAEVAFVGAEDRAEAELVPAAGYEIELLRIKGLHRRNPLRAARAAIEALFAVFAVRRRLRRDRADVVLGGGGYVAGPAGLAAILTGTPLVLTEADSHLGLANRMLARRARRVCLSFPIAGREGERYLLTGRPVPAAVLEADREAARRRFGIASDARCLLVMGGSQGARSINQAAIEAFAERGDGSRGFHVLHLCGERDHAKLASRLAAAPHAEDYTLIAYEPGLADVLAACDLVVSRAGGSIFEVTAAGRPAILVPYPHATADHQTANAKWMADADAAEAVEDADLTPELLAGRVVELLADPARLGAMAAASAAIARPDATKLIADEVLAAANNSPSGAPYPPIEGERRTGT